MAERPVILVTNDDGVRAPGLLALARACEELGEVVVVAPDRNQSAVSHKITLYQPLRVQELGPRWYSVEGTPTDCVYLAIVDLVRPRPSLVVSGINAGPNLAHDVHYSGTVSAAVEGTILGVPSLAFSLIDRQGDYRQAAAFARRLAAWTLENGLPPGTTLNVNVPRGTPTRFQLTSSGVRPYDHSVERRVDPRGESYYWIGGAPNTHHDLPGSDCNAVADGVISVTPLVVDIADRAYIGRVGPSLALGDFERVDPP